MAKTIDGAIFGAGCLYEPGMSTDIPLLDDEQVCTYWQLYAYANAPDKMCLIDAFNHMAAKFPTVDTPLKHVVRIAKCGWRHTPYVLMVVAMKYGWDKIPAPVLDRIWAYARERGDVDFIDADGVWTGFVNPAINFNDIGALDVHTMCEMEQMSDINLHEHITYIANACAEYLSHIKTTAMEVAECAGRGYINEVTVPVKFYRATVTLVRCSLLLSQFGVKVRIKDELYSSNPFKAALILMPKGIVGRGLQHEDYVSRLRSVWDRDLPMITEDTGIEKLAAKGPSQWDLISLCGYDLSSMDMDSILCTYPDANPRLIDFKEFYNKHAAGIQRHKWLMSCLFTTKNITEEVRAYAARLLCALWRMEIFEDKHYASIAAKITAALELNTDDILKSYYSISITNISWAFTQMPELLQYGMKIGKRTEHVVSMAVIKNLSAVTPSMKKVTELIVKGV